MSHLRRALPALLVAALLAALPAVASAAPSRADRADRAARTLPRAVAILGDLWRTLTSVWGEEGMSIDPSGNHLGAPAPGDSGGSTSNGLDGGSGMPIAPNG